MTAQVLHDGTLALPDGRRLGWCEYGAADGQPMVYCHGLPGSRLEHPPDEGIAAARGVRVIAPDRPGYGQTSPRPGRALGEETDDMRALADHLELDRFGVLGFSGGGPHALALAARLPQRVRWLGLIASLAPFDRTGTDGMAEANQQLWDLARTDFDAFTQTLEAGLAAAGGAYELLVGGAPPADQAVFADAAIADAYRQATREAMRQGPAGMLEDAAALVGQWGFGPEDVACPARLWHGRQDANAPLAMGRWLAHRLPRAELTEWPDEGHFGWLRRWGEVLDGLPAR